MNGEWDEAKDMMRTAVGVGVAAAIVLFCLLVGGASAIAFIGWVFGGSR